MCNRLKKKEHNRKRRLTNSRGVGTTLEIIRQIVKERKDVEEYTQRVAWKVKWAEKHINMQKIPTSLTSRSIFLCSLGINSWAKIFVI